MVWHHYMYHIRGHTMTDPKQQCYTLSVPEAGRLYFGLSRNGAYEAAKRGELPTVKILGKLRVPVALLERMLEDAGARSSS